jgi:IMP dehydrogenase
MGSKEARSVGPYASDRYILNSKKLAEGVSDYVPFVGPVRGVIEQLQEGLKNGMIYCGAKTIKDAHSINVRKVTYSGRVETDTHDLLGVNSRKW